MPTYKFKEPNSKIKLHGKWYNDSNLDNEVVFELLKHKPSFLGSVFVEVLETTEIKKEAIKENVNKNEKANKSLHTLSESTSTEAK